MLQAPETIRTTPTFGNLTLSENANERNIQRRSFRGEKSSKSKSLDFFLCTWRPELEERSSDSKQAKDNKKQEKAAILSYLNQCAGVVAHSLREAVEQDTNLRAGCCWGDLPKSLKDQHAKRLEIMLKDHVPVDRCVDNWCSWLLLRESYANFRKRKGNRVCIHMKFAPASLLIFSVIA